MGSSPQGFEEAGHRPGNRSVCLGWALPCPGTLCIKDRASHLHRGAVGGHWPNWGSAPRKSHTSRLDTPDAWREDRAVLCLIWPCPLPSFLQTMGDVKLVASSHISKTSLSVDPSRIDSMPLTEAPAFILPPRNLCIKEGATAKFEGRVRSVAGWGGCGEGWAGATAPCQAFSWAGWI